MLHGRRHCAVINGRVYNEGEALKDTNPDAPPITLVRVEHDRVWLQVRNRPNGPPSSVALEYPAFGAKPKTDATAAAVPATGEPVNLQQLANPAEMQAFVVLARSLLGKMNLAGMPGLPTPMPVITTTAATGPGRRQP